MVETAASSHKFSRGFTNHFFALFFKMATIIPQARQGHTASDGYQMSTTPCAQCTARLLELKRQAMKIMMIEYHKSAMLKTAAPLVSLDTEFFMYTLHS